MSNQLVVDTRNAFAYVQQVYTEAALLIQQVEAELRREEERFVISLPSGYNVVARGSSGIESGNVRLWLRRKFSVFFVPEAKTEAKGGQTNTPVSESVLYIRFLLDEYGSFAFDGQALVEPSVIFGVFRETERFHKKRFNKLEEVLSHIEYYEERVSTGCPPLTTRTS